MKYSIRLQVDKRLRPALILAPFIALTVLVAINVTNTPFWDEWELVPIFQHLHAGHFLWHDFWQQHNEHRIFFPTLLLVGLAQLDNWNILIECLCGLLIAVLSFWVVIKTVARTGINSLGLLILLSLIWFSPVQAENWLWGWQVEWFMNVLGVAIAVFGVSQLSNKQLRLWPIALILGGGVLAQFSLGSGTLIWPLLLAALVYLKIDIKRAFSVFAVGASGTVLYFWNYVSPDRQSENFALHHPITFLHYLFMYLGRPLSFYHKLATVFGATELLIFVGLGTYLFVKNKKTFTLVIAWLVLGAYAISSGVISGLARLNLGVNEAFSSRYTTVSSLLLVSTIVIAFAGRTELKSLLGAKYKAVTVLTTGTCTVLVLGNWAWGIHSMRIHSHEQKIVKSCTHLTTPPDSCLVRTYPRPNVVKPRLDYVKQVHWGGY